jgi:hypothetical protein
MNVLLVLALAMTSLASAAPPQPAALDVGSPIVRSIAAGDSHTFDLRLDAGQTALIEIEEQGIGVDLTVTDANGDTIAQVGDVSGGRERRHTSVAAETAATVGVKVSARRWPIVSGSYTLRLTGFRPFTTNDRELLRAMRLRSSVPRAEEAGNLELATARAAEALTVLERTAGVPDSQLALFVFDLARLYSNGSDREKARPLLERSLALFERSVGPDHPWTASALGQLGVVLTNEGEFVQADAVLHRALTIQEKALAPDDPGLGRTLRDLGSLLERRGDLTKAEEMQLRALAILE